MERKGKLTTQPNEVNVQFSATCFVPENVH